MDKYKNRRKETPGTQSAIAYYLDKHRESFRKEENERRAKLKANEK